MNKLPNGWQEKYIDEVFEIRKNYTNARKDLDNNSNISYLHYGDIHKYYQHHLDCQKISLPKISENKLSKNINKLELVKNGDLIVVDVSEDYEGICSSVEVKNLSYKLVSGLHTILLRDKGNYFADGYKGYIFYNRNVHKECCRVSAGISVYGISRENLKKIKIPIPPLEEQKRIASALSKIDAYLENTIKLIEEKERFKEGIAKKLLNREARFEGFNDEWKEYNLSEIGTSYSGLRNKKAKSFSENCNAKYITYKSIYDKNKIDINRLGNVFVDKNENQNLVKYGDAFFTISSETPNELAISSVLLDEVENTYLNSFCFGFRFDFNILLPEFARYYFRSDYIRKSTYKLAQGITRYNISKNKFLDIKIYIPSIKEQEYIGKFLSLLDAEIDNLKKQEELIKKMKKGIINKLMNGEIKI